MESLPSSFPLWSLEELEKCNDSFDFDYAENDIVLPPLLSRLFWAASKMTRSRLKTGWTQLEEG
jgi:hypothetical protein